eukprot:240263-Prorocentrum_minimum.AAC.1
MQKESLTHLGPLLGLGLGSARRAGAAPLGGRPPRGRLPGWAAGLDPALRGGLVAVPHRVDG